MFYKTTFKCGYPHNYTLLFPSFLKKSFNSLIIIKKIKYIFSFAKITNKHLAVK